MWRGKGYEQKCFYALAKHCFNKLDFQKIYFSIFSFNETVIQLCKEAGFKFNQTTHDVGDPERRHILYFYKKDYEIIKNSIESSKSTTIATSTRISENTPNDTKLLSVASPMSSNTRYMQSIKTSSSKAEGFKFPQITFHKFPQIVNEGRKSGISYSSINVEHNTPLPKIIPPNYYYRSSRYK